VGFDIFRAQRERPPRDDHHVPPDVHAEVVIRRALHPGSEQRWAPDLGSPALAQASALAVLDDFDLIVGSGRLGIAPGNGSGCSPTSSARSFRSGVSRSRPGVGRCG
jgi:hypothetical protein